MQVVWCTNLLLRQQIVSIRGCFKYKWYILVNFKGLSKVHCMWERDKLNGNTFTFLSPSIDCARPEILAQNQPSSWPELWWISMYTCITRYKWFPSISCLLLHSNMKARPTMDCNFGSRPNQTAGLYCSIKFTFLVIQAKIWFIVSIWAIQNVRCRVVESQYQGIQGQHCGLLWTLLNI